MKIHKARLQRIINEELVRVLREAMVPQLYKGGAGLGSIGKIKTSEVDFEWGDYDGRHRDEVYWVSNETGGELGSVQFPGDPYTYESRGDRLVVVSGPEPSKRQIGIVIDRPGKDGAAARVDEPSRTIMRFEDEEVIGNPCGDLTNNEIVNRLKKLTLNEILSDYFPYDKSHQLFNPGSFLGSDMFRQDPDWPGDDDITWSKETLGMLIQVREDLVDMWNRAKEAGHHSASGENTWRWLIYDKDALALGFVVGWIKNGEVPCPPA